MTTEAACPDFLREPIEDAHLAHVHLHAAEAIAHAAAVVLAATNADLTVWHEVAIQAFSGDHGSVDERFTGAVQAVVDRMVDMRLLTLPPGVSSRPN